MRKIAVVVAATVLVASLVSSVFAAETKKGTVKSVDAKAGTIVLSADGKDMTLKADKSVDLGKLKAGDKIEASVDEDVLKSVKPEAAKPKPPVGC